MSSGVAAAADDVGYDWQLVMLLDGGGYGDGAGTAAYAQPLKLSVGQFAIHIFAMMGRYVDVERIEILQLVDVAKQGLCTVSF